MDLAYIGHAVWLFEAYSSALAAGCRDADVLFVYSTMMPHLPKEWAQIATRGMRHSQAFETNSLDVVVDSFHIL